MPKGGEIIPFLIGALITGVVTFLVFYLLPLIQAKKPNITWREFQPIRIGSQNYTALSIVIENQGKKAAKNVRAVFSLPSDAVVESFDIKPSEVAMKYDVVESDKNQREVLFPFFNQGLNCTFTILAKDLDSGNVGVSIIADDLIGKEKNIKSEVETRLSTGNIILIIMLVGIIGFGEIFYLEYEAAQFRNVIDIVQLYSDNGEYDLALEKLKGIPSIFKIPFVSYRMSYEKAKIYARMNDLKRSLYYLEEVKKSNPDLAKFARIDKDFKTIENEPDFIKFINSIK